MNIQISKWGNSLALRIPATFIKQIHLKEGDKVEAQIQDKQIRVSGKKIDDLQTVIGLLREKQPEFKIPLQFTNMKS